MGTLVYLCTSTQQSSSCETDIDSKMIVLCVVFLSREKRDSNATFGPKIVSLQTLNIIGSTLRYAGAPAVCASSTRRLFEPLLHLSKFSEQKNFQNRLLVEISFSWEFTNIQHNKINVEHRRACRNNAFAPQYLIYSSNARRGRAYILSTECRIWVLISFLPNCGHTVLPWIEPFRF